MKYIADLHIHSPYSRATSKSSTLPGLAAWAGVKGIQLVGSGDFTHPGWFRHLRENLAPAEPGFYRLKDPEIPAALEGVVPEERPVRFTLTAEISSIYKRGGKVRKIHNIISVPDLESAARINTRLAGIGNIESDGRPILGLDARNLLEIVLEEAPDGFLVPAHIWTPWFSLFGSKSGFDAIEECFDDLTEHIFALETGLSSDPEMNRLISGLDRFTLISNSDCHSPSKLGREANFFDTEFDYYSMRQALQEPAKGFLGTVEFFPEEGKYHLDGHRKCDVCLEPPDSRKVDNICPVCSRPLTIGVLHRVMELADRKAPVFPEHGSDISYLVPLPELLGEIVGTGPATKGVMTLYSRLIARFGSEFNILLKTSIDELNAHSPVLGEAVKRIRTGKVIRNGGYDGEFGVIKVFDQGDLDDLAGQIQLFKGSTPKKKTPKKKPLPKLPRLKRNPGGDESRNKTPNVAQLQAITADDDHIIVNAGPGTGKTFTLIARLAHLITDKKIPPQKIAAITFTNRAADEVRSRLRQQLGKAADQVSVATFHSFCLEWLRRDNRQLQIIGPEERQLLLQKLFPEMTNAALADFHDEITAFFQQDCPECSPAGIDQAKITAYLDELSRINGLDLDNIIPHFTTRLKTDGVLLAMLRNNLSHLLVDEFQDINPGQYDLVKVLAEFARIFSIGDPNQAIYGFRGSDVQFFFRFAKEHRTTQIQLTDNYRSAPEIIKAAASVISNNTMRADATLQAKQPGPGSIEYYAAPTTRAEAEFVVRKIEALLGGVSHFSMASGRSDGTAQRPLSFGDMAVLYRQGKQADDLYEALSRRGIPVQLLGVEPFFMSSGLRPVFYWLKSQISEISRAEQRVLLKACKSVTPKTIQTLAQQEDPHFNIFTDALPVSDKAVSQLEELKRLHHSFRDDVREHGTVAALSALLPLFEIDRHRDDVQRFLELAVLFEHDMEKLAHHLLLNARATVYDERAEAVSLMTMHGSKGLEFPVVFLVGLEENIIPWTMGNRHSDIEEERRLFYVGMTRAREQLLLSSAASRTLYGKKMNNPVSPFVKEIPENLYTCITDRKKTNAQKTATQMTLF